MQEGQSGTARGDEGARRTREDTSEPRRAKGVDGEGEEAPEDTQGRREQEGRGATHNRHEHGEDRNAEREARRA